MNYQVRTTPTFDKEFKKLDKSTQQNIKNWIENHLINCENPRLYGKGLKSNRSGQWRYRIGDYRIICEIQDNQLTILALSIGHRREIYKKKK